MKADFTFAVCREAQHRTLGSDVDDYQSRQEVKPLKDFKSFNPLLHLPAVNGEHSSLRVGLNGRALETT